jgi:hypothetical protein
MEKPDTTAIEELEAIYNKNRKKPVEAAPVVAAPAPIISAPKVITNEESAPVLEPIQRQPVATSFDGIVSKVLQKKMDQIDREAEAKKKLIEEQFYDKLFALVDSVSTSDVTSPVLVQQPILVSAPLPVSSQVADPPAQKQKKHLSFREKFLVGLILGSVIGVSLLVLIIRVISGLGSA